MTDIFHQIALEKIEEAIKNGEFENLAKQGQPVDLSALASVPPEMRAAYTIIKNSGLVPEEVQLLKEIAELKEKINCCTDPEQNSALIKKLRETELKYQLRLEIRQKKR